MNRWANGRTASVCGFTLIEVVIALTLVSLIMLGLTSAMTTFARTGDRLERRALENGDFRLVSGFLRESLELASAHISVEEGLRPGVRFFGDLYQLEWLGLMPARHGLGGLYHMRLSGLDDAGGRTLVLQYQTYVPDAAPDWSSVPAHLLLSGVDSYSIGYRRLGADVWRERWDDYQVLPGYVRLRVSIEGEVWPEFVIRVLRAEPGFEVDASFIDVSLVGLTQ